ncbi:MAG: chemotaxis protein CheD [Ferruginibacter sp.]|nr:chemotaxis protein CheD [Cytophagales bacterium]
MINADSSRSTPHPYPVHYLYPGTIFAHRTPHQVNTVLGTCVAVCLWDSVLRFGGINHYLLPYWNGQGLASPKYGNIAIPRLMKKMIDLGSHAGDIRAKLFGGKENEENEKGVFRIGSRNVEIAEDLLRDWEIPVLSSSVGGPKGRKILFHTDTGEVFLKYLAG